MNATSMAIFMAMLAFLCARKFILEFSNPSEFVPSNFPEVSNKYYQSINFSLPGNQLRKSLYNLIKRQRVLSYKEVWDAVEDIDQENCTRGQVFDIYSGRCWRAKVDRCGAGGVKSEGQCFNREHAWPKSWCDLRRAMTRRVYI